MSAGEFRGIKWADLSEWKICGQGWPDTVSRFDRLPASAKVKVREVVWNISRSPTGMHVLFETNADKICVRWQMLDEQMNEANFPSAGFAGIDLYSEYEGGWRWAGCACRPEGKKNQNILLEGISAKKRKYLMYFPLRNRLKKIELGLPSGSTLKQNSFKSKPLVYYGTSIVHGACASHPGMVHPAILGRWLNREVINLGFSGNARMEIELAEILAEVNAGAYILDSLPNMDIVLVRERAENFIRHLRKLRKNTPIVMIEDRPLGNWWIKPAMQEEQKAKWAEYAGIFRRLKREGFADLHYIKGEKLFGTDSETMSDNVHPSDLGYMRMAEIVYPVLKKVLSIKK